MISRRDENERRKKSVDKKVIHAILILSFPRGGIGIPRSGDFLGSLPGTMRLWIFIYASRLRSAVEIIPNNTFVMLVIFENDAVSVQPNSIVHVAKILVFKNHISSVKKYHPSVYQKVNNFKLTLFKIILIFL